MKRTTIIKLAYIVIDLVCVFLAIYASCVMREKLIAFPVNLQSLFFDPTNSFRVVFLLWGITIIFFMNENSLYQTRREVVEGIEVVLVIKSVILASLLTTGAIYSLKIYGFPRTVFMNSMLGMIVLMSLWRIAKRLFVEYLVGKGYNNFNILIIGAGKVGQALAGEIKRRPGIGFKIVGFLDDFKKNDPAMPDIKILGKLSDFREIAQRQFIHKLFVTIHDNPEVFLKILQDARNIGIAVRVIPQGFELTTGEFTKYNIGFIPVLEYCDVHYGKKQIGKRIFDFVLSFMAFIMAIPIFLLIAIAIKLDSPGPVFYISNRYGRRGQIFGMYKFRSMVIDAEKDLPALKDKNEVDGPIFKIKNDPRITKIGRFLRRYSLDELPQIINVMKGEMSLVGPRPLPIDQIEREDLNQLKRLEVRPGITGLWQIRGRSDLSFSKLVKWDVWYIDNWSLWLDFMILLQTFPVVFKGRGAY